MSERWSSPRGAWKEQAAMSLGGPFETHPASAHEFQVVLRLSGDGLILDQMLKSSALDYSAEDLARRPIESLFDSSSRPLVQGMIERFRFGGSSVRYLKCEDSVRLLRKDRMTMPVRLSLSRHGGTRLMLRLRGSMSDSPAGRASAMLSEVGPALAGSLDYEQTLSAVVSFAARWLADYAALEVDGLATKAGSLHTAAAQRSEAAVALSLKEQWTSGPLSALSRRAIESGLMVVQSQRLDPATLGIRDSQPWSVIAIPLTIDSRTMGALTLIAAGPAEIGLSLVTEVARRAAQAIENARRLAAAEALAKGRQETMQVVAHELANALGTFKLWCQALAWQSPTSPTTPQASRALEKTVARMSRLLADLRAGAGEPGGLAIQASSGVAPAALVRMAAEAARRATPDRRIDVDLAPGLPDVWADEVRVLQVLANLLGNAVKFSIAPAKVIVGAHRGERPGEVLFFVRDDGIGIAPACQLQIFERGFQVNKRDQRGSGLGLAICKEIIEAHGDSLSVDSRLGEGSTFGFTLRAPAPSPTASGAS